MRETKEDLAKKALDCEVRRLCVELKLKSKYLSFCRNFIIDFDVEKSAIRAGYDSKYGHKLIKKESIRNAILKLQSQDSMYKDINESSLAGQMAIWANSDLSSFYNEKWDLKDQSELTIEQKSCIKSITKKYDKFGRVELKLELYDKKSANEKLSKPYSLYDEQKDISEMFEGMTQDELRQWIADNE